MLTKRRLRYKVSAQVFPAPKGGSFRIRWREMFLPGVGADEDPVPPLSSIVFMLAATGTTLSISIFSSAE